MTRFIAAGVGVALAATAAVGQGIPATTVTVPAPVNPFGTPGTAVGRPSVAAVGSPIAPAAPRAGTPIGYSGPGGMPAQSQRPPGKVIDVSNLAAPLTAPLPPGIVDGPAGNLLDRMYYRWAAAFGFTKPTIAQMGTATGFTPGLSRRNRERDRVMWWRD